jgi:hypothetical protein
MTSEVEAGGDDRQVVEAEEGDLVVDVGVDQEHRRDEQHDEQSLEVPEDEPLHAIDVGGIDCA